MTRPRVPDEILTAAHERAAARAGRDFAEADRLRAVIEAAGWRIVDRGTDFALSPAAPPDIAEPAGVRYGSSTNVPSRLQDPVTGFATVVIVADDHPDDVRRAIDGLRRTAPAGTTVVVVTADPDSGVVAALDGRAGDEPAAAGGIQLTPPLEVEVIRTTEPLGQAASLNAGIRRAGAAVVVILDASVEPTGDCITPLVDALGDGSVAVAGGWGIVSSDLRHFRDAPPGDVDAIEGYCLAFRREDYVERGPLDERFRFYRNLDIWWSLVLRDGGEDAAPRRAVSLAALPAIRHEHRGWTRLPDDERDRQSKRNFYRIIDRFGWRRDLLTTVARG